MITGNYYDETAESYVNRAWSQSARHVIKNAPVLGGEIGKGASIYDVRTEGGGYIQKQT